MRSYRVALSIGVCACAMVTIVTLVFALNIKRWVFSTQGLHSTFETVVVQPVPESVKNIRTDRFRNSRGPNGHVCVFRFDISREDLSQILASDAFIRLEYAKYASGKLHFGVDRNMRMGVGLYESRWHSEPAWFDLAQWADSEAFVAEEEVPSTWYKARFLLYSEERGAAYFLEYEMAGRWGSEVLSVTDKRSRELPEWLQDKLKNEDPNWLQQWRRLQGW